ncbi:MAG TPA: gluconate 2-dehydrogenase subunit 3 family protein [Longimicrobiales bacterium]|nr:gluconate 2-dehydrogenase subunit 3 family protein [Longimicrobiales bacterium]
MTEPTNRRDFLAASASLFGSAWLLGAFPDLETTFARARTAQRNGEPLVTFTEAEARAFTALADQIVPADELPGATEAGAVYFADRALTLPELAPMLPLIREGLKQLDTEAAKSGAKSFADLAAAEQVRILRALENTPFFFNARMLAVMGVFADPSYGGNREHSAERILGIEHRPSYQPPFGYYDAEELNRKARGL